MHTKAGTMLSGPDDRIVSEMIVEQARCRLGPVVARRGLGSARLVLTVGMLIALTAPAPAAADRIAYVTNNSSNSVTPIDIATHTAGTPIPVDPSPISVAITPDGTTAYVTTLGSDGVTPIDIATDTAGTPIPVGSPSIGVAVTPDGTTAYVTTPGSGSVTPIDIATHTAGTPIPVGSLPISVAITPDGTTAYVGNERSGSVTPIDIATNTASTPIPVGTSPAGVAISADGKTAYVANAGSGSVTPIDIATNTAGTPITLSGAPFRVAITPDGKTAYVANEGTGSVTPIDIATHTAGTPITLGGSATGIAIVPDQAPTAAFTASATSVGQATTFDASGSSDSDGTVGQYQWSFGDGKAILTGSPTITHSYATAGAYIATVTVTDNEGCSTRTIFTGQTMSCNGSPSAQVQHRVVVATPAPAPITPVAPVSTAAPHISGMADSHLGDGRLGSITQLLHRQLVGQTDQLRIPVEAQREHDPGRNQTDKQRPGRRPGQHPHVHRDSVQRRRAQRTHAQQRDPDPAPLSAARWPTERQPAWPARAWTDPRTGPRQTSALHSEG
jgi:YVTN family beta-propeller protein